MPIKQIVTQCLLVLGLMLVNSATTAAVYGQLVPPPKPMVMDPMAGSPEGFSAADRALLYRVDAATQRIQRFLRPVFDDGTVQQVPPPPPYHGY